MFWHCADFEFDTSLPVVMGILNMTPDSFSDGGDYFDFDTALIHAEEMASSGARIIDVGGESTRPGSAPVSPDEEWRRIGSMIEALARRGLCVSVDTRHAEVARRAVCAGAAIINDVSGFRDPAMASLAGKCDAGLVVMHMQGEPSFMQEAPVYDDVVRDVRDYLQKRCSDLVLSGVDPNRICIDPGPGFGKTPKQSLELMRNLHELVHLGYPVCAAPSRKSYVGALYHIDEPKGRDEASAKEALYACELGASVVRTHNVAETLRALADLRPYVLLGLGSNMARPSASGDDVGGKIAQINHAVSQLCTLPDSLIVDMSSFYGSKAAYFEQQDDFVNVAVLVRCGIPPRELLTYLHTCENSLGRVRTVANGPRTIDIDIIDYQSYTAESDELILPHPRACERDFVVKPVLEILPHHVLADGTPIDSIEESKRTGSAWRL